MFSMVALLSLGALPALAAETFTLPQLLSLSQSTNKGVEAAQAGVDAASAAVTSARAYPN
ncbi:TolC family protein, partial [Cupriavidus basilensis]|nr:TolC family protein [Cupriavidus basilensis]